MWTFWEYLDRRGHRTFSDWRTSLTVRERATLDEKMRMVRSLGPTASCWKGPLRGYHHLYKIRIVSDRQLRPILCKGPQDKNREFTLLKGAFEVDNDWEPYGAPADADMRRAEVASDQRRRAIYKVPEP